LFFIYKNIVRTYYCFLYKKNIYWNCIFIH